MLERSKVASRMRQHRQEWSLQQWVAITRLRAFAQAARDQIFDEQIAREQLGIEAARAGIEAFEQAFERFGRAAGRKSESERFGEQPGVEAQARRGLEQIRRLHSGVAVQRAQPLEEALTQLCIGGRRTGTRADVARWIGGGESLVERRKGRARRGFGRAQRATERG